MPITAQGMGQPDLDTFLRAIATLNNELKTDRTASNKAYVGVLAKLDADATGGVGDTNYEALLGTAGSSKPWPSNPAAAALVVSGFTAIDMFQEEMTDYLATVETLANELRADRESQTDSYNALLLKLDADGLADGDYHDVLKVGGSGAAWPADPAAAAIDDSGIWAQGVSQPTLVTLLTAIQTLCNELRTDRATQSASFDALLAKLDADAGADADYAAEFAVGGSGFAWPANPAAAALDLSA